MLPFRLDYVVKISTLRRLGGVRLGLETVGLSILTLGLVDAVAMLPLAIAAIAHERRDLPRAARSSCCSSASVASRVLALGPRLVLLPFVHRSERVERIFKRVGDHAGISRSTFAAGGFLFGCWTMRALGSALLLSALGVGFSPHARARHPLPGGGGVDSADHRGRRDRRRRRHVGRPARARRPEGAAINFSLASGMLLTLSALVAAVVGVGGSLFFTLQRRHFAHATLGSGDCRHRRRRPHTATITTGLKVCTFAQALTGNPS